jgi:hypothetical protein
MTYRRRGPIRKLKGEGVEIGLIRLANDGRPARSDASRSVDAVGAGDPRFGVVYRGFADDGGPIWSGAPRSVDAVGAGDRVALWSQSEHAGCNDAGDYDLSQFISPFEQPQSLPGHSRVKRKSAPPSRSSARYALTTPKAVVNSIRTGVVAPGISDAYQIRPCR